MRESGKERENSGGARPECMRAEAGQTYELAALPSFLLPPLLQSTLSQGVSQNELSQTQHPVAHKNARMAFVLRHKRFAARNATTLDVSQRLCFRFSSRA